MHFAHVFDAVPRVDFPPHIIGNGHHLENGTVAVGFLLQLLHHTHERDVIAGNEPSALIEPWFTRRCRFRPIAARVGLP